MPVCSFTASLSFCRSNDATCVWGGEYRPFGMRGKRKGGKERRGVRRWRSAAFDNAVTAEKAKVDELTMRRKERRRWRWDERSVLSMRELLVFQSLAFRSPDLSGWTEKGGEMEVRRLSGGVEYWEGIEGKSSSKRNQNARDAKCKSKSKTKWKGCEKKDDKMLVQCKFGIGLSCCG